MGLLEAVFLCPSLYKNDKVIAKYSAEYQLVVPLYYCGVEAALRTSGIETMCAK